MVATNPLLNQLKGVALKKVDPLPAIESKEGKTLADTLAAAMKQRRNGIFNSFKLLEIRYNIVMICK